MAASDQDWDEEVDLLVFGSGAGGLSAALVGSLRGLKVKLCEKTDFVGGTSAVSGGAIWIVASTQAMRAGYRDSGELGRIYLKHELGKYARDDLIDAYIANGAKMLDLLEEKTDVLFDSVSMPDYHAESPGGMPAGRVLVAKPFDGRSLRADFKVLAYPLQRLLAFGGMMVASSEIPMMLRPFHSLSYFRVFMRNIFRIAMDRVLYPRGTQLYNGNALIGRLFLSLRKSGAAVHLNHSLSELIVKDDCVIGALIKTPTGFKKVKATCGVVLATGGAAHCSELQKSLMVNFPHHHTIAHVGSTGDGLTAAMHIGGTIDHDVATPAVWSPASVLSKSDGSKVVFPYGYLDRGKPGAIAVNRQGVRFVNEAHSYQDVVKAMFDTTPTGQVPQAHLICDSHFIYKYGLGMVRPHHMGLKSFLKSGYLLKASSLKSMANAIGVDPENLVATVNRHNFFASTGVDEDFGKGRTAFNAFNGDPTVQPNSNLSPISKAPFYALPITPATLSVSVGLKTNANAQVINGSNAVVSGLYACGNDMASVMRGCCPGGGVVLGPAMVFGYLAAMHASTNKHNPIVA